LGAGVPSAEKKAMLKKGFLLFVTMLLVTVGYFGYEMSKEGEGGKSGGGGVIQETINKVKVKLTRSEMEAILKKLLAAQQSMGELPTESTFQSWLKANFRGGIKKNPWQDHFGNDYRLVRLGRQVYILSNGPDGMPGTADDLKVELSL